MTPTDEVVLEWADVRSADAKGLLARLTEELAGRYDGEGQGDFKPTDVEKPRSGFLVLRCGGKAVGCGAFRQLADDVGEIKRMYVEPSHRGRGLGRRILTALEEAARQTGYRQVRLETGLPQPESLALYESAGYARITPYGMYRHDPRSVCFEKDLA